MSKMTYVHQIPRVLPGEPFGHGDHLHVGIEAGRGLFGGEGLVCADSRLVVEKLTIEVGGLHRVAIAHHDGPETGQGQPGDGGGAPGPDHEDPGGLESLLGGRAPPGEQHLAIIPGPLRIA